MRRGFEDGIVIIPRPAGYVDPLPPTLNDWLELGQGIQAGVVWAVITSLICILAFTALTVFFVYAITHSISPAIVNAALKKNFWVGVAGSFVWALDYGGMMHPLMPLGLVVACGYNALQIAASEQVVA